MVLISNESHPKTISATLSKDLFCRQNWLSIVSKFCTKLLIDIISMVWCNTVVSPLLMQWRYCSLALNHWYIPMNFKHLNIHTHHKHCYEWGTQQRSYQLSKIFQNINFVNIAEPKIFAMVKYISEMHLLASFVDICWKVIVCKHCQVTLQRPLPWIYPTWRWNHSSLCLQMSSCCYISRLYVDVKVGQDFFKVFIGY